MGTNSTLHEDKREVFIVFSQTNTHMGKIIRTLTNNFYNHVSIALEKELKTMYSFGRYHINSPLAGGFIMENPARYLLYSKDVNIKICSVTLDELAYTRAQQKIFLFMEDKNTAIYNSFSAITSLFHKKLNIENAYTCIEFVTDLLDYKEIINIRELEDKLEDRIIYKGSFKEYVQAVLPSEDEFFQKQKTAEIFIETINHFKRLLLRAIRH